MKIISYLMCLHILSVQTVAAEKTIKVGILQTVESFNLSGDGYTIIETKTSRKKYIKSFDDYNAQVVKGKLRVNNRYYDLPVRISPDDATLLKIGGRRYRGDIIVLLQGRKITVVNELGIDDYVRGVLPKEMNPAWHKEALKAQAVAARSFVWRNLGRHQSAGYDVCAGVHCQVYGGVEPETPTTNEAVSETSGEVLYDRNGEVANAVFHACCGGHTEDVTNVWDIKNDPPHYFAAKPCGYCGHYKHFNWSSNIEKEYIRKKLVSAGYDIGRIKNLEAVGRSISDRVKIIKVIHTSGVTSVPAAKFRLAIDPWRMRSTKLTAIVRHDGFFEFRGSGWGHGVGLCQAGAEGMAQGGNNYDEILRFYYPGTVIKKIK